MDFQEVGSHVDLSDNDVKGSVHVLLVDYDQNSLSNSTLVLQNASFRVTPTRNQQVALTLLHEFKGQFNLLITSDQKQVLDCRSFIQRIRFIQNDIPIIVVSSLEDNVDPGLKTMFDSTCYVVNKPASENTLRCTWQRHQMKTRLYVRGEIHKRKEELEIENVEESENDGDRQHGYSLDDMKENEDQRKENQSRKRSKPCENDDDEEEVARKKGKCVASSSYEKRPRPTFAPQETKRLMEAISYSGPQMPINKETPSKGQDFEFLQKSEDLEQLAKQKKIKEINKKTPSKRQDFEFLQGSEGLEELAKQKKIRETFKQVPRAPWTRYLYNRFMTTVSCSTTPGTRGYDYGAQQARPFQPVFGRIRPSWMTPLDWRAQLNSEFLTNTSDFMSPLGGFPVFGSNDIYEASTSVNRGLNVAECQMPMNLNMESSNLFDSSMLRMYQNASLGTQSNPILVDEVDSGSNEVISSCNEKLNDLPITKSGSSTGVDDATFQSENGKSQFMQWPIEAQMGEEDVNEQNYAQVEESTKEPSMEEEEKTGNHKISDICFSEVSGEFDDFAELFAYLDDDIFF